MINIRAISKQFDKQQVLKNIDLELHTGSGVALIGPNGSGKTTLIKILLGLVNADSGDITVSGKSIMKDSSYRKDIGYMPQISRFPDQMKVAQLFNMMKSIRTDKKPEEYDTSLYEAFEIDTLKNKKLSVLSGGMAQKVSAALAFLFNPKVLVLDEPTAGLDPLSNELLKKKLRESIVAGKLVLLTSHILSDLDEITTDVAYLMEGELQFFKSMEQLMEETSENRLNKIIAQILNKEKANV